LVAACGGGGGGGGRLFPLAAGAQVQRYSRSWNARNDDTTHHRSRDNAPPQKEFAGSSIGSMDMMSMASAGAAAAGKTPTSVNGFTDHGFMINGVLVPGGVMLLPETSFMWNCTNVSDITEESLRLVKLINPRPEVFLIGTGSKPVMLPDITRAFGKLGIAVEVMATKHAVGTFNVLVQEDRSVVACILPKILDLDYKPSQDNFLSSPPPKSKK